MDPPPNIMLGGHLCLWAHLLAALGVHYLHPTEGVTGPEKLGNFTWVTQLIRGETRFEPGLSTCKVCFHCLPLNCPEWGEVLENGEQRKEGRHGFTAV